MAANQHMLFIVIFIYVEFISCARILGVFPIPSISHQVVYRALTTELARRGHEVIVLTPNPVKNHNISNFHQIDVQELSYSTWTKRFNFMKLREASDSPKDVYPLFKDALVDIFDEQMSTPEMQAIIQNDTEHFDLILVESLVPAVYGLVFRFNSPLIGMASLSGLISNFDAMGNPSHPVLYPDIFRKKAGKLNIWEKIYAVYSDLWIRYIDWTFADKDTALVKKHFGENAPPPSTLERRMDMLFLNVHPLIAGIRPVVPGVVYLGSLHLNAKKKLPKDLQQWLDDSTQGVIYMSLGSNVMSKDLSADTMQVVVDVFRDLPYRVLWKFEEDLPNKPKNVRISKWLPQQDLLGHPNIKAFITQGGQQSMEEAIRDNVPLIGIPFIGDQDLNVQNFKLLGIGVGLNINNLNRHDFKQAIMNVSTDISYKQNIKRLSGLLNDQPMTSLERAVWWTEYVLRHRGAHHLRAPAADVSFVEYFLLDVIAVVVGISAAAALTIIYLLYILTENHSLIKIKSH